jgi:AraC-like DNA-binding protein
MEWRHTELAPLRHPQTSVQGGSDSNAAGPITVTALSFAEGAFAIGGLAFVLGACVRTGHDESSMFSPRHLFAELAGNGQGFVEWFWDGKRSGAISAPGRGSLLLPRGQHWVAKHTGSLKWRYITCELEHSVFAQVLGEQIGDFDLRPHVGPSPIAPGLLERLASVCQTPGEFPLVYAESLASTLVVELFHASATKPLPPRLTAIVGSTRFKVVLDFIEEYLDRDISLTELASLVGLSVTHFSHAFKSSYGVSPHRYISQRRIKRAQTLLRTTNDTIATIAARVGFSSQSRFSQVFASLVGAAPSASRSPHIQPQHARRPRAHRPDRVNGVVEPTSLPTAVGTPLEFQRF